MRVDLRYFGHSGVREIASGYALAFEPNLARPKVFFDGELGHPVRFREAVSALHDVVIGDLKTKKKDRTAYLAWKEQQKVQQADLKKALFDSAKEQEIARIAKEPVPPGLAGQFEQKHRLYWDARRKWASELWQNDPDLFRSLVPCDPVVTVAPDVVFFECFAKDESSYACLTVNRDAFRGADDAGLGTTNVDYSLALYEHFQTLRTYRPTRLLVDPTGFEVKVDAAAASYREEKIDLPPSWLRGFGQLQAAMALPATRFELSVDVVYSILAYLKRHREKVGPRSLRFVLTPGKPPVVFLDPWGIAIPSRGKPYDGPRPVEIKVWGRRRLFPLARLLPLAEKFELQLLGSGLPSIWTAHMGEMRFTLALSGWTSNDWTQGTNLDQTFATFQSDPNVVESLARYLETVRVAKLAALRNQVTASEKTVLGSLHALAKRGQLVYDFATDVYRWRPIMSVALSESVLGPESAEVVAGRKLLGDVTITRDEELEANKRLLIAKVQGTPCEGVVDADGGFARAKCNCSHFFRNRLRAGPCRHLIALRSRAFELRAEESLATRRVVEPVSSERRGQVFHIFEPTLRAIDEEALRRRVSRHEVVAQAWRLAKVRIKEARSVDPPAAGAVGKVAQTFELDPNILLEIQDEAARLDVSVSAIVETAWGQAKSTMGLTSSILDSDS